MEILAPVGNLENLKTAINHGADAVYFSAGKFNARAKCQEINLSNLKECVDYAHLFNVKVYLTVNTIIKDDELDELMETLTVAVDCNVDAFIIQDLAVYFMLKNCFSGVELHASTQMGIHNLEGAKFIESLGFKRVVLSRETTLEDIKLIRDNTNLEIEYFVQGALCVAFSGNCYFSSLQNNASGNRGECLQLCRLKYKAVSNGKEIKNGYLLSPSDMCLIEKLNELKDAGVCSLKIEGRLRRAGYVAQAIDSYKRALEARCDLQQEKYNLTKVFSRGEFNQGYLYENKNIISNYQNHMGIPIGKVINVQPFKNLYRIVISSPDYQIKKGDGLKFVYAGEQQSIGVGNVDIKGNLYTVYSLVKPKVNSQVNLTLDSQNEELLTSVTKRIGIDIGVKIIEQQPIYVIAKYKNNIVEYSGDIVESAKSSPLKYEDVKNVFGKLSNTYFELNNFECELNNAFVVKAKLNEIRRNIIEKLQQKIIQNYNLKLDQKLINSNYKQLIKNKYKENKINYCIFDNVNQIKNITKTNIFIYSPTNYNKELINNELNKIPNEYQIYLNLPIITNYKDIKIIDDILQNNKKISGVMANNYWALKYKKTHKILCGYPFNIANCLSMGVILDYADDVVKSCETKLTQYFKQGKAYNGKVSLMTFAHCPQKTCYNKNCSKDCKFANLSYVQENGKTFSIRRTKVSNCYFELVDNKETIFDAKYFCYDLR